MSSLCGRKTAIDAKRSAVYIIYTAVYILNIYPYRSSFGMRKVPDFKPASISAGFPKNGRGPQTTSGSKFLKQRDGERLDHAPSKLSCGTSSFCRTDSFHLIPQPEREKPEEEHGVYLCHSWSITAMPLRLETTGGPDHQARGQRHGVRSPREDGPADSKDVVVVRSGGRLMSEDMFSNSKQPLRSHWKSSDLKHVETRGLKE